MVELFLHRIFILYSPYSTLSIVFVDFFLSF
nr:MAG TPA: hypothetical protein [Caudoviricetes sp.]